MTYEDVIEFYGSAAKAARSIGVSKAAISAWKKKSGVPFLTQTYIQVLTKGKLKAEDRPKKLRAQAKQEDLQE